MCVFINRVSTRKIRKPLRPRISAWGRKRILHQRRCIIKSRNDPLERPDVPQIRNIHMTTHRAAYYACIVYVRRYAWHVNKGHDKVPLRVFMCVGMRGAAR